MKILLTRHGVTEENLKGVVQGWVDGKLSKIGIEETEKLSERLKDYQIDLIYTSDLGRCLETVEILKKYHPDAEIIETKLLRERSFGKFNGRPAKEFYKATKEEVEEEGETKEDWKNRMREFHKTLINNDSNKNILVVSHGKSIRMVQELIFDKDRGKVLKFGKTNSSIFKPTRSGDFNLIPQSNSCLSEIDIDENKDFSIVMYNSKSHLIDKSNFKFSYEE